MSEPQEVSSFFEVKLSVFEGPIDLLLHLVKVNELPIEKIALAQVAGQYFDCIQAWKGFDLEVAGEYLVIAATLLSIKSSVLLKEPVELIEDDEGNLVDPHEELLRRLREAAIFHDAVSHFKSLPVLGNEVFSSPSSLDEVPSGPIILAPHAPLLLQRALQKVLKKIEASRDQIKITFDPISIVDRMMSVMAELDRALGRAVPFEMLLGDVMSRSTVVGTFVALLELCKRGAISVEQQESDGEISIRKVGALQEVTSEFDTVVNT